MTSKIISTGSYVPENIVSNEYLSTIVDTSHDWIKERTGICNRRICDKEGTTYMACKAASNAVVSANIDVEELGYIIVATMSPDNSLPSTACEVQKEIGANNAICFDLNAACTGFVYAIHTANALLQISNKKYALVIGSETLSKLIDWKDRSTCILFADGAGAVVLEKNELGIVDFLLGADGSQGEVLTCSNRNSVTPFFEKKDLNCFIKMNGQAVFKFAVKKVTENIQSLLEKSLIEKKNIKYYVLHQANIRILESVAKRLNEPMEKFPYNLDQYGNTSAASLPILLDELNKKNLLNRGDKIILSGFGGGLTWGSILLEW